MTTANGYETTPSRAVAARATTVPGGVGVATVDIAGVRWPAYKLHALIFAAIVAVGALVLSGSGQVAMWCSAITMLTVWWGERLMLGTSRSDD